MELHFTDLFEGDDRFSFSSKSTRFHDTQFAYFSPYNLAFPVLRLFPQVFSLQLFVFKIRYISS